jgi:Pyruvate kinase, barrel domain
MQLSAPALAQIANIAGPQHYHDDHVKHLQTRTRVIQGQRKNCSLPGAHVDLPVLLEKDINDLQHFACKHKFDFVAASFVQSANDVRFIRSVLDEAGGHNIGVLFLSPMLVLLLNTNHGCIACRQWSLRPALAMAACRAHVGASQ